MVNIPFQIRPAVDDDRLPLALLFAEIAGERDGIATEPPVDIEARAAGWTLDGTLVAVAGTEIVGSLHIDSSPFGFGEIGMAVGREWRGRGVGSALLPEAIELARERGLHKLSLGVSHTTELRSRSTASSDSPRRDAASSTTGAQAASSGTP